MGESSVFGVSTQAGVPSPGDVCEGATWQRSDTLSITCFRVNSIRPILGGWIDKEILGPVTVAIVEGMFIPSHRRLSDLSQIEA